jgi:carbon storage regulator
MLVLSRKIGEEIVIDGTIRVTVVAVSGNKVRLGVTAPDSVRVDRAEVHERRLEFITVEAKEESAPALK